MQTITSGQQRRVEGFAIKRDKRLRRRKELSNAFQHGRLFSRIAHKELSQDKLIIHKTRNAHQKAYVPVPPERPDVSVSRKANLDKGKLGKARIICPLRDQRTRGRRNERRATMTIIAGVWLFRYKYIPHSGGVIRARHNRIDLIKGS